MIDPTSGERLSAWRFGWSTSKKLRFSVNCVEEFATPDGLYLLVGLQNMSGTSGMVCLFDPILSRVIKAIEFPRAVRAIECVTTSGGGNAPQHSIRSVNCLFSFTKTRSQIAGVVRSHQWLNQIFFSHHLCAY